MTCVWPFLLASSNAVSPYCQRGREGRGGGAGGRRGGSGRGLWAARRGGAAPAQGPSRQPHPQPLAPKAPLRLPPRPSAPSLTLSLRRASAPALSSASTQGAWPLKAALCSADLVFCRDAGAAAHTRV